MSFLKKILLNFISKDFLKQFFSNQQKLKYSFAGINYLPQNSFFSKKNLNLLVLNRENNRSSGRASQDRRTSSYNNDDNESYRRTNNTDSTSNRSSRQSAVASNRNPQLKNQYKQRSERSYSRDDIEKGFTRRKVRMPDFSFRDKVKLDHKERLNQGGGYTLGIREIIKQNRERREEQAQRLNSVKVLDQEELGEYLTALSSQVEGKGIVNSQLKVLTVMIFVLLIIMFVIGTFLNKNNPLVPLLASINKPLSIKIVDEKNVKIFETKREPRTLTYASNISQNLENTFIALHALNELIYQKSKEQAKLEKIPLESIKVDQDYINYLILEYRNYINSPRESIFRTNTSILGTITDVLIGIPNKFLDWSNSLFLGNTKMKIGFELSNEFEPKDQPLTPDNKIDTYYINELNQSNSNLFNKNDFYVIHGCKIFKISEDVSNPDCEFSSINIIMTKMYQPDNSGFLAQYLNPIKSYLLINWLKEKVSLSNFFELFLNMTYFGNYQIGLKSSFNQYFEKISPDAMDVPHALFMIKHLYEDNKKYYPNYPITEENILDMMITNNYVPESLKYSILDELKKVEVNAKIPRTTFSIYLDRLFLSGYEHFPDSYDITVKTTFSNALQNSLSSLLADQLKKNNIPNGSVIVIKNNNLLAGLTVSMIEGKVYYKDVYPETYAYNSIKPFMYLTLLNNKKDIPSQILNSNYQNLIFSNKRLDQIVKPVSNPNLVMANTNNKIDISDLKMIESKDLAIIPSGIKKSIAERLSFLENNFFAEATPEDYEAMLKRLKINIEDTKINLPKLLNGDVKVNLYDLTRAYTAFQKDSSIMDSKIINLINNKAEDIHEPKKLLKIRKTYADLLKNIYFNNITSPKGKSFFVMIDFQTAIIFNDDYVISLWMGDLNGNDKFKDTTEGLEVLVQNVLSILQQ